MLDEYQALLRRLAPGERIELMARLSDILLASPRREAYLGLISDKSASPSIRELVRFHGIDTKAAKVTDIAQVFPELTPDELLPESDVAVEDAGLFEPIDELSIDGVSAQQFNAGTA